MTPKSLLRGRTQAQFDFDWGVKGWAFSGDRLPAYLARAEALAATLEPSDERHETVRQMRASLDKEVRS